MSSVHRIRKDPRDTGREYSIDDLLAMQQEFLASESRPAAKAVKSKAKGDRSLSIKGEPARKEGSVSEPLVYTREAKSPVQDKPKKKLSLFAQRQLALKSFQQQHPTSGSTTIGSITATNPKREKGVEGAKDESSIFEKLMKDIPEHTDIVPARFPEMREDSGFPMPEPILAAIKADSTKARDPSMSLVAPQSEMAVDESDGRGKARLEAPQTPPGMGDLRGEIHKENLQRIEYMSAQEIAEAKEEIQSMFSHETLAKLISRLNVKYAKPSPAEIAADTDRHGQEGSSGGDKRDAKTVRFMEGEDDEEIVPPPPPLQPLDQEDGDSDHVEEDSVGGDIYVGEDAQFYKQLKEMYFPDESVEEKKLEWILGQTQARSPARRALDEFKAQANRAADAMRAIMNGQEPDPLDHPAAHLRFGFDGSLIEVHDEVPVHKGLHHHGEDPDAAGYTIPELLHLSRSRVPAQRAIPLRVLGNILHSMNVGAYEQPICHAVYRCWLDWEGELYLVDALRDRNATVAAVALVAIWTWVVEMSHYGTLVKILSDESASGDIEDGGEAISPGTAEAKGQEIGPKVARGELVERTYQAFRRMLNRDLLGLGYDIIKYQTIPYNDSKLLAEIVVTLGRLSDEFEEIIRKEGRLLIIIQEKYSMAIA
ncbi:hypothetical protein EV182_001028 [Spiromyces aspiralis]|uniref:Uncharacterized protein n=1 Tax=Spiromyces aspiralis TaxID=68401 RepID=A0ACC1HG26_9FUNG|nr:hypothetical protein EV182_001028 [Spiromyces aspiralis]